MTHRNLAASQAAARLGISAKALRLYEREGLIAPARSPAGWRLYSARDLARAAEIVSLRKLGFGLAQIGRVLSDDAHAVDADLDAQEKRLLHQARQIGTALQDVRARRGDIDAAQQDGKTRATVSFALPWPWAGERFELIDIPRLAFITGPLGSGKTRFAERLAAELARASFLGLDRVSSYANDQPDPRVERVLAMLEAQGAKRTDALRALLTALEAETPDILVVDMVEEGLCDATQRVLMAYLRATPLRRRALFLMTRSSLILDVDRIGPDEAIIYCPANHSPPFSVASYPGERGYEAVSTCVAPPETRARTAGVIAIRSR